MFDLSVLGIPIIGSLFWHIKNYIVSIPVGVILSNCIPETLGLIHHLVAVIMFTPVRWISSLIGGVGDCLFSVLARVVHNICFILEPI